MTNTRVENPVSELADETMLLKKRARRRLIGAAALALFVAIVLPMLMDHRPAPPNRDIQVRIPSPDEGVRPFSPSAPAKQDGGDLLPDPAQAPSAQNRQHGEAPLQSQEESTLEPRTVTESHSDKAPAKPPREEVAADFEAQKGGGESWEVRLGAYREAGRVRLLLGKLKELRVPAYTEQVETPNGPRTRVRAGPFPSQEDAEKARERIKIIGVDGPVAKKP